MSVGAEETGSYKVEYSPGALSCSLEERFVLCRYLVNLFKLKCING